MSLALLPLLVCSYPAFAEEACISYASNGQLIAGLQTASKDKVDKAKEVITAYIRTAKNEKPEKVVEKFSRLDGSHGYELKNLKSMPDKYASFGGIINIEIDAAFSWGKYIVSWVNYSHQKGSAKIMESVLCTNICQMSNIFERPEESEDLFSRFMYMSRIGATPLKSCPSKAPIFKVFPTTRISNVDPLNIYYFPERRNKTHKKLFSSESLGSSDGNIKACNSLIENSYKIDQLGEDELRDLINKFLSMCAMNMTERSLLPIVEITKKIKRVYLTPISFIDAVRQAEEVKQLYQFSDSGLTVNIFKLKYADGGIKLLVLPLKRVGGKTLIDWSYYSGASGELLSSTAFARYVYGEGR